MEYRFLGIAWPSPVTVDLLLCNMKLQYEAMSTEASVCFEELPGPSIEKKHKKKKLLVFFPLRIYLIQHYVQIWVSIFAMFAV